jgi:hypothetical protein
LFCKRKISLQRRNKRQHYHYKSKRSYVFGKTFIKKALKEDGESKEVINLIRKIKRVKVYTVENATEKMAIIFLDNLSEAIYKN